MSPLFSVQAAGGYLNLNLNNAVELALVKQVQLCTLVHISARRYNINVFSAVGFEVCKCECEEEVANTILSLASLKTNTLPAAPHLILSRCIFEYGTGIGSTIPKSMLMCFHFGERKCR